VQVGRRISFVVTFVDWRCELYLILRIFSIIAEHIGETYSKLLKINEVTFSRSAKREILVHFFIKKLAGNEN
jgi:hypothetical protein